MCYDDSIQYKLQHSWLRKAPQKPKAGTLTPKKLVNVQPSVITAVVANRSREPVTVLLHIRVQKEPALADSSRRLRLPSSSRLELDILLGNGRRHFSRIQEIDWL